MFRVPNTTTEANNAEVRNLESIGMNEACGN
jgi:hypothetical protein